MEVKHLLNLKINKETAEESTGKLLETIKPNWTKDKYQIKHISEGSSSLTFRCYEDNNEDDTVAVRIRYKLEDYPLSDPLMEIKVVKKMSELGLFPKLLAIFENGYCYEFTKGVSLFGMPYQHLAISDAQLRLLAKKLADIHSVKIEGEDYSQSKFFHNVRRVLDERYPRDCDEIPSHEDLKKEFDFLEEKILRMKVPIVQCHGDPHLVNVIWNEDEQSVMFIDWELTHIGFQAHDIAYMLQLFYLEDDEYQFSRDIPKNYERIFIQTYHDRFSENSGKLSSSKTDTDIDILMDQVTAFRLVSNIYTPILFGSFLLQKSAKHNDEQRISITAKFCRDLFKHYKRLKEHILHSKQQYLLL